MTDTVPDYLGALDDDDEPLSAQADGSLAVVAMALCGIAGWLVGMATHALLTYWWGG